MKTIKIEEILTYLDSQKIQYKYNGDMSCEIKGFSSLTNYKSGTMTWVRIQEKADETYNKNIALLIVQDGVSVEAPNQIITSQSKQAFFSIIEHFYDQNSNVIPSISEHSYIAETVKLGKNVSIGHGSILDGDIIVGDNTVIGHNVTIVNRVHIGNNCTIQAGCTIGLDGYAYVEDKNGHKTMVRHHGGVVIEDDVLIGANCNIARGTIDDTIIGENTKIDTNVHIAHNVKIGKSVSIIPKSVIMGSVQIGKNAYISTSIIRDQVKIGEGAYVAMGAAVTKDVPEYTMVGGIPAKFMKKMEK